MSEERILILNMLQEGKITNEEALKLLDAIGEKDAPKKENTKFDFSSQEKKFETAANNFFSKIASGVDSVVTSVQEQLSNIDIDLSDIKWTGDNYNQKTSKVDRFGEDGQPLNLNISNNNGKITIESWTKDFAEIQSLIRYDDSRFTQDHNFVNTYQGEGEFTYVVNEQDTSSPKSGYYVATTVYLPNGLVNKINTSTVNGKTEVSNITIDDLHLESVNGKIVIEATIAKNIIAETVNGKVVIDNCNSEDLNIDLVNGKISISELNSTNAVIENVNGSISIDEILEKTKEVKISSVSGGVYLIDLDKDRPIKLYNQGRLSSSDLADVFTKIEGTSDSTLAYTESYTEDAPNLLNITVNSVHGKTNIK